jgi:hypothetical protein
VLVTAVARGDLLGPDQPVILHMLDIAPMQKQLDGTVLELEDCAFPLLKGIQLSNQFTKYSIEKFFILQQPHTELWAIYFII